MKKCLVAVVLAALVSACSSTVDSPAVLAESIGDQLAEEVLTPLVWAAEDATSWSESQPDLVLGAIHELPLPADVDDLIPGTHMQGGRLDDGSAYVGIAIAVFRKSGSDFCMVVALGTDGQVKAGPAIGEPLEMCEGAEIPNLLEPTS